jgi:protein-disulfide isomerase
LCETAGTRKSKSLPGLDHRSALIAASVPGTSARIRRTALAKKDEATNPGGMSSSTKTFVIGALAVAAILGVGFFYIKSTSTSSTAASSSGRVSLADLYKPGPLGDKVIGKADAPVTIVEYASITCPHCATFHIETYPTLKKDYIDTGKVKLIFREFPTQPAKVAISGFMLARCSGDNYFPFISALFEQQQQWRNDPFNGFLRIAKQAGMSQQAFEKCLEDGNMAGEIENIARRAVQSFGVESTPTFFINERKFEGAIPVSELSKLIDPLVK